MTRYARIQPQVLQVEIHPYLTQEALVKQAELLGIVVTAYSSFGPQSYVELGGDKGAAGLLSLDLVTGIASRVNKSWYRYPLVYVLLIILGSTGTSTPTMGRPERLGCHSKEQ